MLGEQPIAHADVDRHERDRLRYRLADAQLLGGTGGHRDRCLKPHQQEAQAKSKPLTREGHVILPGRVSFCRYDLNVSRSFRVALSSTSSPSVNTTPYCSRAASKETSSSATSARTRAGSRSSGSPQPPPPPVRTIASALTGTGMCAPIIGLNSFSCGRRRR